MNPLIISFLTSFVLTVAIIRSNHLHERFSSDNGLTGPQKFHLKAVPRIGGASIAAGIFIAILYKLKINPGSLDGFTEFFCSIPVFVIGITEDCTKKISIRLRLLFTALSAILFIYLTNIHIARVDIPLIDAILSIPIVGIFFTVFAITGLANSYNIIDGFNGLASMVGIITLGALAYIGYYFNDPLVIFLSLTMASAILGFFILNYPNGYIFLGDGGAYLIGFWIAIVSILTTYRHVEISPWFALLVNGYPITETIFTIYRRKIHQGKNPAMPDGIHLHTLIFRRILKGKSLNESALSANARTSPYLWLIASIGVIIAISFYDKTSMLLIGTAVYVTIYLYMYKRVVRFQIPNWLY